LWAIVYAGLPLLARRRHSFNASNSVAAAASPTAAHRGLSIAKLFEEVARRSRNGTRPAAAADLPTLLDSMPSLPGQEDFVPYDGRDEVLLRWGDGLFRVLAGSLERPSARLNQQSLLAAVIDHVLVPELGFGLADVGELILRRVDDVTRALAPHWPAGAAAGVDDAASVTQAEVDAAAKLPPFDDLPGRCRFPDRATTAAARYTVTARDLPPASAHAPATFGTAIATRIRGRLVALPAPFLVEALTAIGIELAARAAAIRPAVEPAFARSVELRVARLFQGSGQRITGPVRVGSNEAVHSLVVHNDRQFIALNVVAGLKPETFFTKLIDADRSLGHVVASAGFDAPGGSQTFPANAQIVRAIVLAGPHPERIPQGRFPVLTLEDLEWILYSARQTPDDLWYFLRDLGGPAGVESMFAWDTIDRWEVWRQEKSFYRGGMPLDHLMFAPHQAVAEWRNAAAAAPLERAVHVLGLRPLRDWPIVVPEHRRGAEIGDLTTGEMWQVLPWPVPVAIAKTDPSAPHERNWELWRFAVGVAW